MSKWYDPDKETLVFEEREITFYLNDFHHHQLNGAVVITHLKKEGKQENCFRDEHAYLQEIFGQYLKFCRQGGNQANQGQDDQVEYRGRMIVLAQFQGKADKPSVQKRAVPFTNFPTYGVAFDFDTDDDGDQADPVVRIVYRQILRQSFLPVVLKTWKREVTHPNNRHCLILEPTGSQAGSPEGMFTLQPYYGPLASLTNQPIDARVFSVAKHGWLIVFLKHRPEVYVLTEEEYLVMPAAMKSFAVSFKRLIDVKSGNSAQLFYRKTGVDHELLLCDGMFVQKGVLTNQTNETAFALLGIGNANVNLTFLQAMLSK